MTNSVNVIMGKIQAQKNALLKLQSANQKPAQEPLKVDDAEGSEQKAPDQQNSESQALKPEEGTKQSQQVPEVDASGQERVLLKYFSDVVKHGRTAEFEQFDEKNEEHVEARFIAQILSSAWNGEQFEQADINKFHRLLSEKLRCVHIFISALSSYRTNGKFLLSENGYMNLVYLIGIVLDIVLLCTVRPPLLRRHHFHSPLAFRLCGFEAGTSARAHSPPHIEKVYRSQVRAMLALPAGLSGTPDCLTHPRCALLGQEC